MEPGKKRRRAAVSPVEWEAHRGILGKLYLVEDLSVKEIVDTMRAVHNFDASKAQYHLQFTKWGFRKNLRGNDWHFINRYLQSRKGKDTLFYLNKMLIPNDMIKTELPRHVSLSQQYLSCSGSEVLETPAGLFVCTPAAMAIDTIRLDNLPWFQFGGIFRSQSRPSQSDAFPAGQSPGFWRYVSANASATQPVAESSLEVMLSVFGPGTPKSPNVDQSKKMASLLPRLEVDVPEFCTEEFTQKWEMLSSSSHDNTILHFMEYAVYLSSNNMLTPDQTNAVFQWLVSRQNRLALDALVSSRMPTAQAFIHEIFKCALRNGHLHAARTLFETGIDFSEVLQSSRQILDHALFENDVELTQFFLGGIDATLFTGLLYRAKSVETTQLLLQAGVDVNELYDWYGFPSTALGKAVMDRNFELAEFLIKEGADVNLAMETEYAGERAPLRAAVEKGDLGLVKLLLDNEAEVDALSCPWEEELAYHWATPLQVAAASGDVKLATILLRSGADVNAPGYEMSALHWAVNSGSIELIRLLLTRADPNTPANNEYRSTAIQIAAECGNTDAIQVLLAAGAISNLTDQCLLRGQLRQAIKDGCIDRARAILQPGIDVSNPFSDQSTILQEAIDNDDLEMVQLLVKAGADVNTSCCRYRDPEDIVTPLQLTLGCMDDHSSRLNAAQIARVLLKEGADPNPPYCIYIASTPLHLAVAPRDQAQRDQVQANDLVRLLLIHGASVNAPRSDSDGTTALQLAVEHWNRSTGFDLLQLLLKYGADVNAPGHPTHYGGGTALQIAVRIGDIELIQFLLDARANVNTPVDKGLGRTALQEAVGVGDLDLIRFLLGNGADINSPAHRSYGKTALQQAIRMAGSKPRLQAETSLEEQRLKVVKLLMEKGAKINAPPAVIGGRTALQAAAEATTENSSIKLMQYLLDAGADVNASAGAEKGLTALQGAAIRGHVKFALMLLERDADVNAPGSTIDGRTALEGAAEHGRLDMVQILINVGADSHLPGRQRYRSAARFAAKEGHVAVANLLKNRFEE